MTNRVARTPGSYRDYRNKQRLPRRQAGISISAVTNRRTRKPRFNFKLFPAILRFRTSGNFNKVVVN